MTRLNTTPRSTVVHQNSSMEDSFPHKGIKSKIEMATEKNNAPYESRRGDEFSHNFTIPANIIQALQARKKPKEWAQ
jgi:hypothetical protein